MIVEQRTVNIEMLDVFTDDFARGLRPFSGMELAEVQRLRGGHELDTENAVRVVQDLSVLEGDVHAHRHEVLLVGRGGDGLDRSRRGENPLLHDEMVGGVLREHQPGIEAGFVREEVGESLRERGVGQAVEPPLGQHADHRDGRARHVHRKRDGRSLKVRAGQG
ncbi:MAG: hypothetical protein PGMFKBFP_02197 [Anaerolineales bacterium]|nr:hypothetical protein [Anaerolineales bacterium]